MYTVSKNFHKQSYSPWLNLLLNSQMYSYHVQPLMTMCGQQVLTLILLKTVPSEHMSCELHELNTDSLTLNLSDSRHQVELWPLTLKAKKAQNQIWTRIR